jgi:hypothetical protein
VRRPLLAYVVAHVAPVIPVYIALPCCTFVLSLACLVSRFGKVTSLLGRRLPFWEGGFSFWEGGFPFGKAPLSFWEVVSVVLSLLPCPGGTFPPLRTPRMRLRHAGPCARPCDAYRMVYTPRMQRSDEHRACVSGGRSTPAHRQLCGARPSSRARALGDGVRAHLCVRGACPCAYECCS